MLPFLFPEQLVRLRNYLQFKAEGPKTQSLWKVTELVDGEAHFEVLCL